MIGRKCCHICILSGRPSSRQSTLFEKSRPIAKGSEVLSLSSCTISSTMDSRPSPTHTIFTITLPDPSSLPSNSSSQSVYHLLADGSILAPSFFDDLAATYLALVIMGSIFTIFARNITLSAAFLWSGRVRKKSLLYTLFLSQLLGPVAILSLLIAQFHPHFDCKMSVNSIFQLLTPSLTLLCNQHDAHCSRYCRNILLFVGTL